MPEQLIFDVTLVSGTVRNRLTATITDVLDHEAADRVCWRVDGCRISHAAFNTVIALHAEAARRIEAGSIPGGAAVAVPR